jgi:hypothetical protein
MINLLLGLGCRAHLAPAPMPVGETGVARARAVGAEGDRPACTSGLRLWKSFRLCCPRGRSGRPPRPVPDPPGLHPCPRDGGALCPQTEKGRLCRSEAKASRRSRDRLKRHPQEGQHSAASWRDPGPSASGERHSIARGIEAEGRDALRLGSRKPGAVHRTRRLQLSAHERKQSPELELEAKRGALQHSQKKKATAENDNA